MGMGAAEFLKTLVLRPAELRSVIQHTIMRDPLNDIEETPATSGWDRESMRTCWKFLDLTSRSFAFVIKELQGDLCRATCIFYLVLRALDTIEDDMTLKLDVKVDQLRNFHKRLSQPGWHFDDSGPNEKDRIVLVEFFTVIEEFERIDEKYQKIIVDIAEKMGSGMAHYAEEAENNGGVFSVNTLADFDLYCHYVAGVVGEGMSSIFSASGLETPELAKQLTLSNSMGLLLQKVNILRDFREDIDQGRLFWPKEIWGRNGITNPKQLTLPENAKLAEHALSAMVLDTLQHAIDSLEYIALLKNQSIFNFCAIPQMMAIATLNECFANPQVFQRNVKIRRSLAAHLIVKNTNPISLGYTYVRLLQDLHRRIKPSDPSFVKLVITIGRIEQWVETRYPSWLNGPAFNQAESDKSARLPSTLEEAEALRVVDARVRQLPSSKPKPELKLTADVDPGAEEAVVQDPDALTNVQQFGALLLFALIFFGMIFIPLYMIGWFGAVRVKMPLPFKLNGGFS